MAGTLFGLGLMPQFDASGNLARGALLYLYQENTSTPVTVYSDYALSSSLSWPVEADSSGRLPAFWLADGSYRARLTTSAGIEIFDEQSITAIGAGTSGSTTSAQDSTTLFQTGYFLFDPIQSTLSGFVRANAQTIGNGSSGATERANSDTQDLFEYLWNSFSDADCPVTGGRGASALIDYNANKKIATPDFRDCVVIGRSGMGNTSSGLISDTLNAAVGATTATIGLVNLPSTTLSIASLTGSVSTVVTVVNGANQVVSAGGIGAGYGGTGTGGSVTVTAGLDSGTVTFGGSIPLGGSGTALPIIPKGRVGNWFIKL